jgi:Ni/Co efflux regulator RcnB
MWVNRDNLQQLITPPSPPSGVIPIETHDKKESPMKTFTAVLAAAALVAPALFAAPAMAQPSHQSSHRQTKTVVTKKTTTYKTFRKGDRFDRNHARNYQQVDYRKYRNVKAPPRGYHYVRAGNDLLLVGITSGIVSAVTTGMFR